MADFAYFSKKTCNVGAHLNHQNEAFLNSIQNLGHYLELIKIIFQLSSNKHTTCFSDTDFFRDIEFNISLFIICSCMWDCIMYVI